MIAAPPYTGPIMDIRYSVIIPARNAASTITKQLAALEPQCRSVGGVEVLVADNGSSDGTASVVENFEDFPELILIDAGARPGASAARNIAAARSRGEILLFVDADDVVDVNWLSVMTAAVDGGADLVGGGAILVRSGGEPSGSPKVPSKDFLPFGFGANLAVRRQVFDDLSGFDEGFRVNEDVDFCWRAQTLGYRFQGAPEAYILKGQRASSWGAFVQHLRYGRDEALLFKRFREHGMRRNVRRAMKRWAWICVRLLRIRDDAERHVWVRALGDSLGQIGGSVRHRTFYLA